MYRELVQHLALFPRIVQVQVSLSYVRRHLEDSVLLCSLSRLKQWAFITTHSITLFGRELPAQASTQRD